jgi:hypothetical protein
VGLSEEDLRWLRSEFERCTPWLQAAIDRDIGAFNIDDVWDYISTGRAQLWPSKDSAVVTAIEYFPRKTVLRYWLCGGELKDCLKLEPTIEAWAKSAGAEVCIIGGRDGWLKALSGYRKVYTSMVKELT